VSPTLRFLAGRVLAIAGTLLATSVLVFASVHLAPGDPESFLLKGRPSTPDAIAAVRAQYHLDDSLPSQYVQWLGGVLTGDFGRSLQFRQDVGGLVADRLPTTALLVGYASLLMMVGGVALGIVGALRPGIVDRSILLATTSATATPAFVAAIVLISVLSIRLGWFPAFGNGDGIGDRLYHLTLPAVALALSLIGLLARVTRAATLDELGREHVEVARSRGIPERLIVRRHVLRNAIGPIFTVAGVVVSTLLVTTVVVEIAFGLSGVGSLLVQAVTAQDFPVVQAICLLIVAAFVVTNLIVDLCYPLIDPRVRLGGERGA
jgi:peptide/nickel transport system permease protein